MKKIIIFLAISILIIAGAAAQTDYGSWSINPCFKGFSYRSKSNGYITSVDKYSYTGQVQNNYGRKVTFNMYWEVGGEKQTIGQFTLSPGAVTNAVSYYFKANSNMMYIGIEKVCFADAAWGCGVNGMCFADCDNGSPNIPTNCGGNTNTTTNQTKNTNTYQTNTNSTNQSSSNSNTSIYTPPTTQTKQTFANTLLQNPEFIDATANALDDFFASIKKRKEEKRRQRELKEEAKQEQADKEKEKMSYHTLFETKAFDAYCQYAVNELLQKGGLTFKSVEYYGIFDNSKSVIIRFDKLKLTIVLSYYAHLDLTANITLEFRNKDWTEEILRSDAFTFLRNNNVNKTIESKKIFFSTVKFDADPDYKTVALQLQNGNYPVNVNRLLDSITQRAEGPIDTTKDLTEALRDKGNIYNGGIGILWDKQIALEYYKKAWELGDVKSAVSIGYILMFDPFKDYVKARVYFDSAAARGEITAMDGIGLMYQYGNGVPKDVNIAKGLFEKAASLGDLTGMFSLYYLCKYDEVEKNPVKAKEWLQKACKASNPNKPDENIFCDMLEQEE